MNYIDNSRSVQDYVDIYVASTGSDPSQDGGVAPGSIAGTLSMAGFSAITEDTISQSADIRNMVIYSNPDGTGHAVVATTPPFEDVITEIDSKGNVVVVAVKEAVKCWDPTLGKSVIVYTEDISTIYHVKRPGSGSGSGSGTSDSSK